MNILYLLGNGFDLNLNMKTSYPEFYKNAYQGEKNDAALIRDLKENIHSDIKDWADLEERLGVYTEKLKTIDDFDLVFDNLRVKLAEYISNQDSLIPNSNSLGSQFLKEMVFPYNTLEAGEIRNLNEYVTKFSPPDVSINVITFNYTRSLEKIINYSANNRIKIEDVGKHSASFNIIEHIHGTTDDRFILGVDNLMQIANETFRNNRNIINTFVKPMQNIQSQQLVDERCGKLIDESQVICLFGLSIGETDKTWWNRIGNRLKNNYAKLIIFWKGRVVSNQFMDKKQREKDKIKDKFINNASFSEFSENEKESIRRNIHVAYNSDFFKIQ